MVNDIKYCLIVSNEELSQEILSSLFLEDVEMIKLDLLDYIDARIQDDNWKGIKLEIQEVITNANGSPESLTPRDIILSTETAKKNLVSFVENQNITENTLNRNRLNVEGGTTNERKDAQQNRRKTFPFTTEEDRLKQEKDLIKNKQTKLYSKKVGIRQDESAQNLVTQRIANKLSNLAEKYKNRLPYASNEVIVNFLTDVLSDDELYQLEQIQNEI